MAKTAKILEGIKNTWKNGRKLGKKSFFLLNLISEGLLNGQNC